MRRAMREEADSLNQTLLAKKHEEIMQQKKKDFYGNIFYSRRPETPAYDKKNQYKSTLEEQIAEKLGQTEQRKVETKKRIRVATRNTETGRRKSQKTETRRKSSPKGIQ